MAAAMPVKMGEKNHDTMMGTTPCAAAMGAANKHASEERPWGTLLQLQMAVARLRRTL